MLFSMIRNAVNNCNKNMYIPITNTPADVVVIANIKNKKHVKYYQGRNSKEKKLNKGDQ